MLIISDTEKPIGMPIMGGANSEISVNSKDIALEAASFLPALVRRSSRLLGLHSESGLRFERGVDAATTKKASDCAAYLISKYCAGDTPIKIGPFIAEGKTDFPDTKIELRLNEIKRHLNLDLSSTDVKDLLERLEFSAADPVKNSDKLVFAIPSFRQADIKREIDLIEEVARMYGYNNIQDEMPAFFTPTQMPDNTNSVIREALTGQGFCEACITSLIPAQITSNGNEAQAAQLNAYDPQRAIKVLNPLSPEHEVLRQSLLPGLVNTLKYNRDRGEENVWLFEFGFTYFKHQTKEKPLQPAQEDLKIAGIMSGNRVLSNWQNASMQKERGFKTNIELDFYDAKGAVENILNSLHIPIDQIEYKQEEKTLPLLHPANPPELFIKMQTRI